VFETIFAFLFKYHTRIYSKGDFAFGASRTGMIVALVLVGAAAAIAVITYQRVRASTTARDRWILLGVRGALLLLLFFCLMRPMLVLQAAIPLRNVIGILLDDSRSMQVADQDGKPRSDFVKRTFANPSDQIIRQLGDRFMIRYFKFAGAAERVDEPRNLTYLGPVTHVGDALERARQELASVPLAGLVVVTDGADNSQTPVAELLLSLRAKGVPVYTVGVGEETFKKDVEITRIESPHEALKGAAIVAEVQVNQTGYSGQKVDLVVEDSGRIVATEHITLSGDGEPKPIRVHVPASEAGPRLFKFRIAPQPGEVVTENNEQEALVLVSNRVEKILYFEGQLRWEFKFLREAISEDPNLQLVALMESADEKYARFNVENADDLVGGFPKSRSELFKYTGLVLGSVSASEFTNDQLKMIADFVGERGGGLLALGGRNAFGEGGFAGTPVADVLPVEFEGTARNAPPFFASLRVQLTPAGMTHAAVQIASTEDSTVAKYRDLPALSAVNDISRVKPGATALLTGNPIGLRGGRQIVLAYQRYGRGKSLAFPVQDTWIWQMDNSLPFTDMTHETLWRQLLRWLVTGVPGQTSASAATDRVAPDEPVALRAEVTDSNYLPLNDGRVVAHVRNPVGEEREVPMDWAVDRDGEYHASFTPGEPGLYRIRVDSYVKDKLLASDTTFVEAEIPKNEYYDAKLHTQFLKRIATETDGRYYTPKTLSSLPEDMTYTKSGATVLQQFDLWDMPAIFLLLVALLGAEWGYRKLKGLA
jgi:uncharacterized membrane protein